MALTPCTKEQYDTLVMTLPHEACSMQEPIHERWCAALWIVNGECLAKAVYTGGKPVTKFFYIEERFKPCHS